MEELIQVDHADRPIRSISRTDCHDGDGVLHRAFSIFLVDRAGRLLLQKRSLHKWLWPLCWSNSCCGHPRWGEVTERAARRRLGEELNISASLRLLFKFRYLAHYKNRGCEQEVCSVFVGTISDDPQPDPLEVAELWYIETDALAQEMAKDRSSFTPWFILEWERILQEFGTLQETLASHVVPIVYESR